MDGEKYTVGELCTMTGITRKTLFYYDRIRLLEPTARIGAQKQKIYSNADYERLRNILKYKEAGLLLNEIREILDMEDQRKKEILLKTQQRLETEIEQKQYQIRVLSQLIHSLEK
ncbi:MAG: MerR family transcriptional regulator [Solobacterium sp.]|nr:MerR family transcriptional regulator [Solobacterium sp.]